MIPSISVHSSSCENYTLGRDAPHRATSTHSRNGYEKRETIQATSSIELENPHASAYTERDPCMLGYELYTGGPQLLTRGFPDGTGSQPQPPFIVQSAPGDQNINCQLTFQ